MAPPTKRRKVSPPLETEAEPAQPNIPALADEHDGAIQTATAAESATSTVAGAQSQDTPWTDSPAARSARFAALKNRATASARSNLAAARDEAQRSTIDPTVLANLSRKSAIAQHNLLKADTEEEGGVGAFERKRAWDYTIEESERWDERMKQKKERRDKNVFQDYGAEAGKIYERQLRELEKDGSKSKDEYQAEKARLLEQAAKDGGLEVVEMQNGEMVAIDRDGRLFKDTNDTGFVEQRPKKENVDRLVEDLRKAEEMRMKKRTARRGAQEESDVTYINEKNKQFNMKLSRFYDRYTGEIRESFERGTAL